MALESVQPRYAAAVALLAFLPVAAYGITYSVTAGVVTAINLLLIYGSLYVAMSPVEGGHGDSHHGGTAG